MTEVVKIDPARLGDGKSREMIARAGSILRGGGLVAFPTETVYGLGGNAFDAGAAEKIYAAKGRPSDNPLIVHIARLVDLERIAADIPRSAYALAERFWPGPLTIILKKRREVPEATTGGLDTVAVRFPSHPVARALILSGGGFVAAPSANASGRPSPTRAAHCIEDLTGKVNMIIDGGEVGIGVESSIVDLTERTPVILRPGYITQAMLAEVLGGVEMDPAILAGADSAAGSLRDGAPGTGAGEAAGGRGPKAPGMKYRHYAPKGNMFLVRGDGAAVVRHINEEAGRLLAEGRRVGVLASRETAKAYAPGIRVYALGKRDDPEEIARNLFRALRQCDADGVEEIRAEAFAGDGLYAAIRNRMEKACGHQIIEVSPRGKEAKEAGDENRIGQ